MSFNTPFTLLTICILSLTLWPNKALLANELDATPPVKNEKKYDEQSHQRIPKYHWEYRDRDHSFGENAKHLGIMYAAAWAVYPLSQPGVFKDKGSFKKYKHNFGRVVFDQDEPFWNQIVHPITGSQLFLYFRANGYDRMSSFGMTFITSALFEFTVEVYTEPASIQDTYQTPILGSILGLGLETFSLYLLNTGNTFGRVVGHIINPSTMFPFFEGKRLYVIPQSDFKNKTSLQVMMEF